MSDYTRIRLRRSSASGWLDIDPVLALGEAGYESDSKKLKVGDGVSSWSDLDYLRVDPSSVVHPGVSLNIYDGFDQRLSIDLSNNEYLNIIGSGDTNILYDDNTNSIIIDTKSGDSFLTYENIVNKLGFIPQRLGDYSLSNHRHSIPDISGLQLSLDNKQPTGLYSLGGHVHQLSIGDGLNKVINYNTDNQLNLVGSGYTNIFFDEYTNTITIGSIGNSGVLSVNSRTGDVILNFADITSAIGYVPQPVGQYSTVGHKHYAIDIIDLEDAVLNGILDGGSIFYTTGTQIVSGAKTFNGGLYSITPLVSDSGITVATTAFVKNQSYLTGNQNITFTGDVIGSGATSVILTLANRGVAGIYTKVTTDSKGRVTSGATLASGDIPTIDVGQIYNFDTQVRTNRLDQLASPISNVNLNSKNITNLSDPVNAQDAATKAYVDATRQGLDIKDSVRVASTSSIILSGAQIIDGVVLNIGDRVLVKEQSTASQNGIYVVSSGAWSRSADTDTGSKVTAGMFVFIEEGETNGDCGFVLITNNPVTLGTTNLSFTQFNGAGQIYASSGIAKAGNTFYAIGTSNRINISANSIDIANNYVGQSSITTLGTITGGIWSGSVISPTYGGLGLSSALSGLVKGNGSSYSSAVAGTDYAAAIHSHVASGITDFNTSVSGLIPVKNIVAGTNIIVSFSGETYTINSNGSAVNDDQNILANQIFG